MAKKEKTLEEFITDTITEMKPKLLLQANNISWRYGKTKASAEIDTRYPYTDYLIVINKEDLKRLWDKKDYDGLRHVITHEVCHIITDHMYIMATRRYVDQESIEDAREKLTDRIAEIVLQLEHGDKVTMLLEQK